MAFLLRNSSCIRILYLLVCPWIYCCLPSYISLFICTCLRNLFPWLYSLCSLVAIWTSANGHWEIILSFLQVGSQGAEGHCVNIPWSRGGVGDNDYIFAFQHVVLSIGCYLLFSSFSALSLFYRHFVYCCFKKSVMSEWCGIENVQHFMFK